ncbi:hypothetical protein JCM14076_15970 [Methylosoma difficile]
MTLQVIIDHDQVKNVRIREGQKNGRNWRVVSQNVWIKKPNQHFPEQYSIDIPSGADPYPAGNYTIDIESMVTPGQFKSLSLDTRGGVLLTPHIKTGSVQDLKTGTAG